MNKHCKDALYHAWTNVSPEEVSAYNKGYYADHKLDWVRRKQERLNKVQSSILDEASSNNSSSGYSSEHKYIAPDYEWAGEKTYDILHATIDLGKKFINKFTDWRKEVHTKRQDTTNTIPALIKSGINWLKNWLNG